MSEFPLLPTKQSSSDPVHPPRETILLATDSIFAPPAPLDPNAPSCENPAVARCTRAYFEAHQKAVDAGKRRFFCNKEAENAFRGAMPPLSGQQNIQDFIACVAQGMLLGAILVADGSRFLYAAQIAAAASRPQPQNDTKTARRKANPAAKS